MEAASVIGRVFALEALAAISSLNIDEVMAAANRLAARQLLSALERPSDENASFSHGLVRDVTYESLTKERRAELHEAYAGWAEEGGRVRSSVIAHHLDRAYVLRCELGLPGEEERVLAARAAIAFAMSGQEALEPMSDRPRLLPSTCDRAVPADRRRRSRRGRLAREAQRAVGHARVPIG